MSGRRRVGRLGEGSTASVVGVTDFGAGLRRENGAGSRAEKRGLRGSGLAPAACGRSPPTSGSGGWCPRGAGWEDLGRAAASVVGVTDFGAGLRRENGAGSRAEKRGLRGSGLAPAACGRSLPRQGQAGGVSARRRVGGLGEGSGVRGRCDRFWGRTLTGKWGGKSGGKAGAERERSGPRRLRAQPPAPGSGGWCPRGGGWEDLGRAAASVVGVACCHTIMGGGSSVAGRQTGAGCSLRPVHGVEVESVVFDDSGLGFGQTLETGQRLLVIELPQERRPLPAEVFQKRQRRGPGGGKFIDRAPPSHSSTKAASSAPPRQPQCCRCQSWPAAGFPVVSTSAGMGIRLRKLNTSGGGPAGEVGQGEKPAAWFWNRVTSSAGPVTRK